VAESGIRQRLQLALREALRARDTIAVSALRSAEIVRAEVAERQAAARDDHQAGHPDPAARLRREAQALTSALNTPPPAT
jgi:uncharacterized protein YqeY